MVKIMTNKQTATTICKKNRLTKYLISIAVFFFYILLLKDYYQFVRLSLIIRKLDWQNIILINNVG